MNIELDIMIYVYNFIYIEETYNHILSCRWKMVYDDIPLIRVHFNNTSRISNTTLHNSPALLSIKYISISIGPAIPEFTPSDGISFPPTVALFETAVSNSSVFLLGYISAELGISVAFVKLGCVVLLLYYTLIMVMFTLIKWSTFR